jgi:GNAT superfamily N-acetyltransferase
MHLVPERIVLASERPGLADRGDALTPEVWPEYNLHGDVTNAYWKRILDELPELQFVLWDEDADAVLAQGHTIPFAWDGTPGGLPDGFDGLLVDAFALREAGGAANALSALAVEIAPEHRGRGTSATMLAAMKNLARAHDLRTLVAPLRPSWKERYPLVPIERYAAWTREDGLPFDPWIRTHARLGAHVVRCDERSLAITGTVAEWESWTDMAFPESGEYVFPRGLAPVSISRERDRGLYYEPNVWVEHPLDAGD